MLFDVADSWHGMNIRTLSVTSATIAECLLLVGFRGGRHSNPVSTKHLLASCYAVVVNVKYSSHLKRKYNDQLATDYKAVG